MTLIILQVIFLLVLLMANGVFAMTEMSVVSSRKGRLKLLAQQGGRGAEAALKLAENPGQFLPTVQVGITLVGLLAGAFGGTTLSEGVAEALKSNATLAPYAEAIGLIVVVTPLTFLSLVVGELVPKRIALSQPEAIACRMAAPMVWISKLTRPVVRALAAATELIIKTLRIKASAVGNITDDEVKSLLQEGMRAGVFHHAEPRMVESILAFDQCPVSNIMTPRGKVIFLRHDEHSEMMWHKIVVSGHSSFPVYREDRDRVVGVISVKSIYANIAVGAPANVTDLMMPPLIIQPTVTVISLLESFKKTGKHIAIIEDKQGRFLGLVTLVDVLEAIVGEIPSLEDRLKPEAKQRDDKSWLVDGAFDLAKLRRLLLNDTSIAEKDEMKRTLESFIKEQLGTTQKVIEGCCFEAWGMRFEVLDMDGEHIDKVLITPILSKQS